MLVRCYFCLLAELKLFFEENLIKITTNKHPGVLGAELAIFLILLKMFI